MASFVMQLTGLLLLLYLSTAATASAHNTQKPLLGPSPIAAAARTGAQDRAAAWAAARARAAELVAAMTLEEKVNITGGFSAAEAGNTCAGLTGSVPRLRWPGLCLHDAGNGVRAADLVNAYPAALHTGAAWDRALARERARHMGREFRAKGSNKRFSVDPYLSGQLNAETIIGLQEAGVIASIKHLVGNEQETNRRSYFGREAVSSNIDDKTLHEFYLWPFVDGVRAGVASVMCSYNRLNSTYACENDKLLNGLLKSEMGFEGFVLLDWNAQHNLYSVNAGLDMVMPSSGSLGANLTAAVRNGTVSEARVTDMATRIIAAWYLLGQDSDDFPAPGIGMKNLTEPHEQVDARVPESRRFILEGAIAGHVLVKNDGSLPFKQKPTMLSVFGYDATVPATKNTDVLFQLGYTSSPEMADAVPGWEEHFDQAARGGTIVTGGRAGANAPAYIIDPLSAIQHRARADGTWVNWDVGSTEPAVNAASDACLVFVNAMATEGWDRSGLRDGRSDALVRHVAARCARTVVVAHAAGAPSLVDAWIDHPNVTAAVLAHLPGQDSGEALMRLLHGDANFSGRLPYTLARREADYGPAYAPCGGRRGDDDDDDDPQCDFVEGVLVDYRGFDARNVTPRFEFGFGLSYTTFAYSSLSVEPSRLPIAGILSSHSSSSSSSDTSTSASASLWQVVAVVSARVANAGGRHHGAEVAQLYLGFPSDAAAAEAPPPRQLRGFDKTRSLAPGGGADAAATVRFKLTRRDLSAWDVAAQAWRVRPGTYRVEVGASSRDIRLTGSIEVY
ncbi:glycoside hydrolase family 3 protein [Xylariaceae sp. FL0804]|nr:glycoside hydrolase family 3 protein [Xylariaceae sp. FL0804]